jgi:hypothetical protein
LYIKDRHGHTVSKPIEDWTQDDLDKFRRQHDIRLRIHNTDSTLLQKLNAHVLEKVFEAEGSSEGDGDE